MAWPGVALGTAEVYARYRPPADARERVASLAAGAVRERATSSNSRRSSRTTSAAPAEELCPPIAALRARLLAHGALAASVSGSGSAVFGLFASEERAQAACGAAQGQRAVDRRSPALTQGGGARITA